MRHPQESSRHTPGRATRIAGRRPNTRPENEGPTAPSAKKPCVPDACPCRRWGRPGLPGGTRLSIRDHIGCKLTPARRLMTGSNEGTFVYPATRSAPLRAACFSSSGALSAALRSRWASYWWKTSYCSQFSDSGIRLSHSSR